MWHMYARTRGMLRWQVRIGTAELEGLATKARLAINDEARLKAVLADALAAQALHATGSRWPTQAWEHGRLGFWLADIHMPMVLTCPHRPAYWCR